MKKILLMFAVAGLFALPAKAQEFPKNIFGAKVGLNVADMSMKDRGLALDLKSRAGFFVGGTYQRLLLDTHPLYLETGLGFSQEGSIFKPEGSKTVFDLWYMQIPVMINYKFDIAGVVKLYPSIGLYYAVGIGGKAKSIAKYNGTKITEKQGVFGKYNEQTGDGGLSRSDLGMKIAATAEWNHITFSIAYGFGFLDIAHKDMKNSMKTHNSCFNISVGYNF